MPQENGVVHLWDLPEDKVCVKLPDVIQKNMIEDALSIELTLHGLSKKLNVHRVTLQDFKKSRFGSTTLKLVIDLSKFLVENGFSDYSLSKLEKQLKIIKAMRARNAIYNPKFPIDFNNKSGAQMISAFLFDGGITSQLFPFYTNNEELLVQKLIKNVKEVVGEIDYNRRSHSRSDTIQIEFPKILGYMLVYGLRMTPGSKIFKNPHIPSFILQSKSKIQKAFLRQAFDDDGSIHSGRSGRSIQLDQYNSKDEPPIRLLQLKKIIKKLKIPVNGPYSSTTIHKAKRGYMSYRWTIQISNLFDIYTFAKKINFNLVRKKNKLKELLDSYVLPPRFKKGTVKGKILKVCKDLKKKNKKITIKNIANKLNRSESYIAELTRNMVEEKNLKIVREKIPIMGFGYGFEEKEFDLIRVNE